MCDALDNLLCQERGSEGSTYADSVPKDSKRSGGRNSKKSDILFTGDLLQDNDPTDMSEKKLSMLGPHGLSDARPARTRIPKGLPARFTVDSTVTLIYGPPGRGKSYLLKQMYQHPPMLGPHGPVLAGRASRQGNATKKGKKKGHAKTSAIDSVVIFTPSAHDWEDVEGATDNIRGWDEVTLAKIMLYQSEHGLPVLADGLSGEDKGNHMVIIMDDLLSRINFTDPKMIELFTRHRHYNISIVVACQNISKTIHPIIREQTSRFICFDPSSCDLLHKAFCGAIWPSAKKMYDDIKSLNMEETHSYLVINTTDGTVYETHE